MTTQIRAQWKAMLKDTVLKEARSKTLIFIFIATTLMILLAHQLLKMFINSDDASATKMIISGSNTLTFMFNVINAWSVVIAGIFGISSIRSDFKDKIIYQYLTFPISRTHYMLCRITGTWLLVFGYYLYSYLLSALMFSLATSSMALTWSHLISILLMGVYVLLIIIISFLYSMFAGKIASFLLLIATVVTISVASSSIRMLAPADYLKDLGFFKGLGLLVYFLLPRVNYVTEVASAVMSKEEFRLNLGLETLHLVITTALLVFIAERLLKRKNF